MNFKLSILLVVCGTALSKSFNSYHSFDAEVQGNCGPSPMSMSIAFCYTPGNCANTVGYACSVNQGLCCPAVDWENSENHAGPAVNGLCPGGYLLVEIPGVNMDPNNPTRNMGTCVSLDTVPGSCPDISIGPCSSVDDCPLGTCNEIVGECCLDTVPSSVANDTQNENPSVRFQMINILAKSSVVVIN